jgi:hypothetical protein
LFAWLLGPGIHQRVPAGQSLILAMQLPVQRNINLDCISKKESLEPDDVEHSADGHSAADCITELHVTSTGAKASGPAEIWFGKKNGGEKGSFLSQRGSNDVAVSKRHNGRKQVSVRLPNA